MPLNSVTADKRVKWEALKVHTFNAFHALALCMAIIGAVSHNNMGSKSQNAIQLKLSPSVMAAEDRMSLWCRSMYT